MKSIKENELEKLITEVGSHDQVSAAWGFHWLDTPSHGYLIVGKKALSNMPDYMRETNYSKVGKYEEDCDWCLPVVCNRSLFSKRIQLEALKTLYNWHPEKFKKYFDLLPIESYLLNNPITI